MRKKKTILLITSKVLPIPAVEGGGIEQLITSLLKLNETEGLIRFIVVSKYNNKATQIVYKNTKVYYFENDYLVNGNVLFSKVLWYLFRIWRKVFKNNFPSMDFFIFQCAMIAIKEKVDIVVHEGRDDEIYWDIFNYLLGKENCYTHIHWSRKENKEVRKIVNNSISISKYVKDSWVKDQTITGKNVVLYNGINVGKFLENINQNERLRRREALGISKNEYLVLYCGRIVPEKGIRELLDAFERLRDLPIKLLLIGNMDALEEKETDFLREIKKRVSENSNIVSLGYIDNDELPYYYSLAHIQVIPSVCEEGAGLIAIEGMAAGLPLIATRSGGMVEYIDDAVAIIHDINKNLSQNIATSIIELINNNEKRREMSEAGRQRAMLFGEDQFYNNFVDIFEQSE